jgi:chromosome segregation ATPase
LCLLNYTNSKISEERQELRNKIREIQKQLASIDEQLDSQANNLVISSFSLFALEEVAAIKDQQGKLSREQRELEKRYDLLERITMEKFKTFLNRARKRWHEADTLNEKQAYIVWLISKISVTNDIITAHFNFDTITKKLCEFHIAFDSIEREKIMKLWRKY